MKKYDVVIIGAGPAGYKTALLLGDAGKKTLLIDKSKMNIGGTCLNEGCIPTKNYLESAKFISHIDYFNSYGVEVELKSFNLTSLKEKTTLLKNEIRSGVVWMLEQSKVDTLYGDAIFVDTNTIEVAQEQIEFEKCIIATGSQVRQNELLQVDSKHIITSAEIFTLDTLPKSITIIGGGAIACEAATFFNAFGVEVTLIVRNSRLIPSEDEDISKALLRGFKKRNITVHLSTTLNKVQFNESGVELFINNTQDNIKSELVLSAIGRIPNTNTLNLRNAQIEQDTNQFIVVNSSFETSQKNIYAIGDCINTPAFAHTAYAEAKTVAHNIINNEQNINSHITPITIFTNPSIASCGIQEKEAQEKKIEFEVKKAYFKVNAKAKIIGDDSGFAKVIICSKSGMILGCSIIGVDATEIIHEMLIAIESKMTIQELRKIIHAHPTISEIISFL